MFSTVVGINASDVDGVLGLSDLNTGELITKLNNKSLAKALRFDFSDENAVSVLVGIIVTAGSNLLGVSQAVQNKVAAAVQDMIGIPLTAVNIQISDVRSR